jgi:type I restriction enzyme M protein
MSQGLLFRGQPGQTEEEDGQDQKSDGEQVTWLLRSLAS